VGKLSGVVAHPRLEEGGRILGESLLKAAMFFGFSEILLLAEYPLSHRPTASPIVFVLDALFSIARRPCGDCLKVLYKFRSLTIDL